MIIYSYFSLWLIYLINVNMVDCPYIDDVDAISTLYFVYIQFFTIWSLAVVIVFVYFIWKEMKERIIDILKILQHSSIVFWFFICVLDNVVHLSTNNNYKFAYVILFQIDWFILIYYALNQLSWFVLSLHMTWYKEMGSDANYFNSRNSVKRKERIWFILLK